MAPPSGTEPKEAAKHDILLPGEDYVLQTWKLKPGTSVRIGETVAIACLKSMATTTASVAKPSSHKRPNRRRRMLPNAVLAAKPKAMSVDSTTKNNGGQNTGSQSLTAASIQARLTKKFSGGESKDKETLKGEVKAKVAEEMVPPKETATSVAGQSNVKSETVPVPATANGLLRTTKRETPDTNGNSNNLAIGYIEECLHPGFMQGLCIVCGISIKEKEEYDVAAAKPTNPLLPEGGDNLSHVTVSGGITMIISKNESEQIAQQDTERLLKQRKLSLVLDLDHTLVHATSDHRASQYITRDDVRSLRLPIFEGMLMPPPPAAVQMPMFMQHYVKLRPHICEFFNSVMPMYELSVYTAGTRQYAEEITIVLCRHLLGSTRDADDLARMRYGLHHAETEYAKWTSMVNDSKQRETEEAEKSQESKKRKLDVEGASNSEPAAKKRKKVSFGAPTDTDKDSSSSVQHASQSKNMKSDHITLAQLEMFRKEMQEAEELEKRAWELRQKVFGSRVVSRTDVGDLGRDVKSLKRIFPCGGTMAAVVDDREDVWANASDNSTATKKGEPPANLLLVRPYHWAPFHGFADINNAAGADLSGAGPENEDPDVETDLQLQWTSQILQKVHKRYYAQDEKNRKTVPELLAQMRREVLRGTTLCLSGLVPLHKKNLGINVSRPPIVRYAQSLGCMLSETVQSNVTHVVASKDGTDKCLSARKVAGCFLVKASWLVECYWSMTRRDEAPHLLGKPSKPPQQPLKESTVDNSSQGSTNTDSEDDDLAAAFEDDMLNS